MSVDTIQSIVLGVLGGNIVALWLWTIRYERRSLAILLNATKRLE